MQENISITPAPIPPNTHTLVAPTTPHHLNEAVVTYSETGFNPRSLNIPIGTQVSFLNLSGIPLWVASDPHPAHSDNPIFDEKQSVASGETYQFTFDAIGTFSYHNHIHSLDRGFIRVFDPDNDVPNIDKTVKGLESKRDKLVSMLVPNEPDSIFVMIDAIQSDKDLLLNCHDIAHDLGHRAYDLFGFSEAMTFNNPNHVKHPLVQYICAGGYMHGILESLALYQPKFLNNPSIMCNDVPQSDKASCFHGIGHVFMLAYLRNASSSVVGCRQIPSRADMYRCFEGVRMEQFWGNTDHIGTSTLGWDERDPLAPCIASIADEKPTCFLYVTFGYLRSHKKDYPGAVRLCTENGLPNSDAAFCLKGLGITMMSKFKGQHLEGSEQYVKELPRDLRYAFYQGVLGYARLSGVSDVELTSTCGLLVHDSDICISALNGQSII